MPRVLLRESLLVLAFAAGTYGFGWWAVPAIGGAWGLLDGSSRAGMRAGAAAAVAWALLLAAPAVLGAPMWTFGARLAGAMRVPRAALWIAELVYPFALAYGAALAGSAVRRPARTRADAAPFR